MNWRNAPRLRIARPSRDLNRARDFYTLGLGLHVLFAFEDHEGFDGVILGLPAWPYEIEFTRDRRALAIPASTEEDLLVFYLPDQAEWNAAVRRLRNIAAAEVAPSNPYWERGGLTFQDADGYRVVIYRGSPSRANVQANAIEIRPYEAADEAACRACMVELQDSERAIDQRLRPGESMVDAYLAQMHVHCRENAGSIFVAERGGEIVGLVMVLSRVPFESLDDPPGTYALVAELVVRDGFRRQGIARALLDRAERYARDYGASELRIMVLSDNTPARTLYLREGFAPYKETLAKPLGQANSGA